MLAFAPDYDRLPLISKVEVFQYALDNTEGSDMARVCILWDLIAFFYLINCKIYFKTTYVLLF